MTTAQAARKISPNVNRRAGVCATDRGIIPAARSVSVALDTFGFCMAGMQILHISKSDRYTIFRRQRRRTTCVCMTLEDEPEPPFRQATRRPGERAWPRVALRQKGAGA